MSALPPKADVDRHDGHVRLVPIADSCSAAYGGDGLAYSITSLAVASSIGRT